MFQMFQIPSAMKCLSVISLATLGSASPLILNGGCEAFFAGACGDLSENNLVDRIVATNTPGECQVQLFSFPGRNFFIRASCDTSFSSASRKFSPSWPSLIDAQDLCRQKQNVTYQNSYCFWFTHNSTHCFQLYYCREQTR